MYVPIRTADDLAVAFNTLPDAEKRAFIEMLRQAVPPTREEIVRLINAAPPSERDAFFRQLSKQVFGFDTTEQWLHAKMNEVVVPQVEAIRLRDKQARDPKPRKTDRYIAIHDLRTIEKITDWKTIRRRLRDHNPLWVQSQKTGKLLSIKTLMNGYKIWLAGKDAI